MNQLVIEPLLVPLVTAILTLVVRRYSTVQRGVSVLGGAAYVAVVALLWTDVDPLGAARTIPYQLGNWPAPFGITLVADPLSVFMLGLAAIVSFAALVFSVQYVDEFGQRLSYHPLYHFMLVGVSGAFLTGDIFNLFVWFEVMLMSSYVLVVFYSGPQHTRAALQYVVLNLIGSAVMLLAIGGIYSTTGTLNMADLAHRLANPAANSITPLPVLGLSALLFTVFALKSGLAPFQFWVPPAYSAAPAPVSAMLAGVVKKVGIYAIIRLYFTVFSWLSIPDGLGLPGLSGTSALGFFGPVMFIMATASILLGGLGAVGRDDIDGLLAYSSIGQVGFIVLPLAIGATAGSEEIQILAVTAALIYSLNHALAKGLLFLASGSVFSSVGSTRFADLGGLTRKEPVLSAVFFVGALSLIGIPPLSGFFGKFLVFRTAGDAGASVALAIALLGAILTIAYFSRAWNRGFWGAVSPMVENGAKPTGVVVLAGLAALVLLVGIGFDPVLRAAEAAAGAAIHRQEYIQAVLGGGAA
ncbi:NADH-ubiquinone/plastoquinone family protein [Haladaptatus paucihalophilus DX253]|uniref:Multicomponent Na+:H+ antiporter subunit D n=1 Tax=Haladaptatus paucihalophilus DX253 TaxID=797209 RepID=E7QS20_HALPU|nr:Na+/H+ antiporter subunit D [Haladaptatus paucihalophilus]EFW92789.1 NADH-ubiquinone/plastoquinone family protein [Haladaptatus paucihalophilus DX253]SHK12558.1 multicomponent Na+:H+ antiporter subunit D [Haladaptatus paucihalophilus DX253]